MNEEKWVPESQKPVVRTREQQLADFLQHRQRAYQLVFGSELAKTVLEDLAKFCRAEQTTFDPDPRIHAVLEGRREVWLRIQDHLKKNLETLLAQYSKGRP